MNNTPIAEIVAGLVLVPLLQFIKSKTGWQDEKMALTTAIACLAGGALVAWLTGQLQSPQALWQSFSIVFAAAWALYQLVVKPIQKQNEEA